MSAKETIHRTQKIITEHRCPVRHLENGTAVLTTIDGHEVLIDGEDVELLSKYKWQIRLGRTRAGGKRTPVVTRYQMSKKVRMCTDIINPKEDWRIEHIDRNPLNNTRANLKVNKRVTDSYVPPTHFKGVKAIKDGSRNPYEAFIKVGKERIVIGRYVTAEAAAAAYDCAAFEYFGEDAPCNL
jgi:hypothetical protein